MPTGKAHHVIFTDESGGDGAYWRAKQSGYSMDLLGAGLYSREEAERVTAHCGPEKKIKVLSLPAVLATVREGTVGELLLNALVPKAERAEPSLEHAAKICEEVADEAGPTSQRALSARECAERIRAASPSVSKRDTPSPMSVKELAQALEAKWNACYERQRREGLVPFNIFVELAESVRGIPIADAGTGYFRLGKGMAYFDVDFSGDGVREIALPLALVREAVAEADKHQPAERATPKDAAWDAAFASPEFRVLADAARNEVRFTELVRRAMADAPHSAAKVAEYIRDAIKSSEAERASGEAPELTGFLKGALDADRIANALTWLKEAEVRDGYWHPEHDTIRCALQAIVPEKTK